MQICLLRLKTGGERENRSKTINFLALNILQFCKKSQLRLVAIFFCRQINIIDLNFNKLTVVVIKPETRLEKNVKLVRLFKILKNF